MQDNMLGIHMIVRNEELTLPGCLDSFGHEEIEWFITDTGSSDLTIEIAKVFGAVVLQTVWQDDFAQARNISLPLAGTEWILCVDADERAEKGWEIKLLTYLSDVPASITRLRITMDNQLDNGEHVISHPVRLFRANHGYRYEGRIHEQLIGGKQEAEPLAPLRLLHDGYKSDVLAVGQKPERNLRLLQLELAERPRHGFHLYNLGVTYCQLGQMKEAAKHFANSLRHTVFGMPYRPTLVRDYAKALAALKRYEDGRALLAVERQHYPEYADLHFLHGEILEHQGLWEQAYHAYEKAAGKLITSRCIVEKEPLIGSAVGEEAPNHLQKKAPEPALYVTESGVDSYKALTAMARLAQGKGRLQDSIRFYHIALECLPTYGPGMKGLADVLQEAVETDESIASHLQAQYMRNLPESRVALVANVVSEALASCGAYAHALHLMDEYVPQAWEQQDLCLLLRANRVTDVLGLAEQRWKEKRFALDAGFQSEEINAWAIASWGTGTELSPAFIACAESKATKKEAWLWMDRILMKEQVAIHRMQDTDTNRLDEELESLQASVRDIACSLMVTTVQTGQLAFAAKVDQLLVQHIYAEEETLTHKRWLAGLLYREGYTMAAADILLWHMDQGDLDAEGIFYLGEILYAKGVYDQALALFQRALETDGEFKPAKAGMACSYLQLATEVIRGEMERSSSAAELHARQKTLEQGLHEASVIPWRTPFRARERRNQLAEQSHFVMHDRQG